MCEHWSQSPQAYLKHRILVALLEQHAMGGREDLVDRYIACQPTRASDEPVRTPLVAGEVRRRVRDAGVWGPGEDPYLVALGETEPDDALDLSDERGRDQFQQPVATARGDRRLA